VLLLLLMRQCHLLSCEKEKGNAMQCMGSCEIKVWRVLCSALARLPFSTPHQLECRGAGSAAGIGWGAVGAGCTCCCCGCHNVTFVL
jgi:hypothetical protein